MKRRQTGQHFIQRGNSNEKKTRRKASLYSEAAFTVKKAMSNDKKTIE
jgi:hypothetical protein